jgi:hypothetical protein
MGTNRLFTHVQLTLYKMGENLFTRQVGSVDNEGYCTKQGMTYHGLQYNREKATVTVRIKLSRRKLVLGEHENRDFKCSPLEHHCTLDGGVGALTIFSIIASSRNVMMTMDNEIMNRFGSIGSGKVQPKRDFCRVIIITFGGCCCCC